MLELSLKQQMMSLPQQFQDAQTFVTDHSSTQRGDFDPASTEQHAIHSAEAAPTASTPADELVSRTQTPGRSRPGAAFLPSPQHSPGATHRTISPAASLTQSSLLDAMEADTALLQTKMLSPVKPSSKRAS